jgi:hypothetical protein
MLASTSRSGERNPPASKQGSNRSIDRFSWRPLLSARNRSTADWAALANLIKTLIASIALPWFDVGRGMSATDPKATYARPPSCKHQTYNCWPSRPIRSPPRRAPVSRAARRDRGFWRSWHAVRGQTTFLFNCQPSCTRAPDPARLTRSGSGVPFQCAIATDPAERTAGHLRCPWSSDRDLGPPQGPALPHAVRAAGPARHSFLRRSAARNKFYSLGRFAW